MSDVMLTSQLEYCMATDKFPYDLESSKALALLIQAAQPSWGVTQHNVKFEDFQLIPTSSKPGRTFVDVVLLDQGRSVKFMYRRLDIAIALGDRIEVEVEGDVTPRKIVEQLNKIRGMQFSSEDVFVNDRVLAPAGKGITYRMRARLASPVWYGETILVVKEEEASEIPANIRLLEDGSPRLMEDGSYRLLEA